MTTVLLRNNTKSNIKLPNGMMVQAGRTATVPRFEYMESSDLLRAHLRVKAIEILTDEDSAKALKEARSKPFPAADDPVRKMGPGGDIYMPAPQGTEDAGTAAKVRDDEAKGKDDPAAKKTPPRG